MFVVSSSDSILGGHMHASALIRAPSLLSDGDKSMKNPYPCCALLFFPSRFQFRFRMPALACTKNSRSILIMFPVSAQKINKGRNQTCHKSKTG